MCARNSLQLTNNNNNNLGGWPCWCGESRIQSREQTEVTLNGEEGGDGGRERGVNRGRKSREEEWGKGQIWNHVYMRRGKMKLG